MTYDFKVVIPARYASTRLPGKPLRNINGHPMIQYVVRAAENCGASEVIVATDDVRIYKTVEAFGGKAVMTSPDHESGTARVAEVADSCGWSDSEIVINVQGDEPLINKIFLYGARNALLDGAEIGTVVVPLRHSDDLYDENVVKVMVDNDGRAINFSRAPIPWVRGQGQLDDDSLSNKSFLSHVGVYAYRVKSLRKFVSLLPCEIERLEALEQLKAIYHGMTVGVTVVKEKFVPGVDTEKDLERVCLIIKDMRVQNA